MTSTRTPVLIVTVTAWADEGITRFRVRCTSSRPRAEVFDRYAASMADAIRLVRSCLEGGDLGGGNGARDD